MRHQLFVLSLNPCVRQLIEAGSLWSLDAGENLKRLFQRPVVIEFHSRMPRGTSAQHIVEPVAPFPAAGEVDLSLDGTPSLTAATYVGEIRPGIGPQEGKVPGVQPQSAPRRSMTAA